jgi:lipopolysaccharide transport system permease protein
MSMVHAPARATVPALFRLLVRHWPLTWAMARREVSDRYAGQVLGAVWAVGHPLLLMAVYLFVFAFVFKVRLGDSGLPLDYSVYLLAGFIPWLAFQDCMNRGATVVTGNANLVKQVVFPLEVLPAKSVLATLLPQVVCTTVLIVYTLASHHALPWTYVLLPALFAVQVAGMLGVSMALSSVGVYLRDVKDVVQVFGVVGVYLLPIFYLPDMVPPLFRPLLYLNPFSYLVWCYQDVCYFGRLEHPWAWPVCVALCLGALAGGHRLFQKLKPYFGNVL